MSSDITAIVLSRFEEFFTEDKTAFEGEKFVNLIKEEETGLAIGQAAIEFVEYKAKNSRNNSGGDEWGFFEVMEGLARDLYDIGTFAEALGDKLRDAYKN